MGRLTGVLRTEATGPARLVLMTERPQDSGLGEERVPGPRWRGKLHEEIWPKMDVSRKVASVAELVLKSVFQGS